VFGTQRYDSRVRRLLEELGYRYEIDSDGDFKLTMNLGEGRSQVGFISSKTASFGGLEIRDLFSVAYVLDQPPTEKIANFLLRDNAVVKMGAWRITGGADGGRCGLVFAANVAADCDARTFSTVWEFVLRKADAFEKEIFQTDKF
jgi:hypothetical protein